MTGKIKIDRPSTTTTSYHIKNVFFTSCQKF